MSKIRISYEVESPLPDWATPAVLLAMQREGKSLREIGRLVGVSYECIRQKIQQAKRAEGIKKSA